MYKSSLTADIQLHKCAPQNNVPWPNRRPSKMTSQVKVSLQHIENFQASFLIQRRSRSITLATFPKEVSMRAPTPLSTWWPKHNSKQKRISPTHMFHNSLKISMFRTGNTLQIGDGNDLNTGHPKSRFIWILPDFSVFNIQIFFKFATILKNNRLKTTHLIPDYLMIEQLWIIQILD